MADKPLFNLDAEGRWRLAYDPLQWIVQRRKTLPRPSEVGDSAESRWRADPFIGSTKRVLHRVLSEKGVVLTPEPRTRFDALAPADGQAAPAQVAVLTVPAVPVVDHHRVIKPNPVR